MTGRTIGTVLMAGFCALTVLTLIRESRSGEIVHEQTLISKGEPADLGPVTFDVEDFPLRAVVEVQGTTEGYADEVRRLEVLLEPSDGSDDVKLYHHRSRLVGSGPSNLRREARFDTDNVVTLHYKGQATWTPVLRNLDNRDYHFESVKVTFRSG